MEAMIIARKLNVPILLHTGDFKECHASVFKPLSLENPDLTFVLAHSRPIDETLDVLQNCTNTMVDTAFMPPQYVLRLAENGYTDRILFGTDAPINLLFYEDRTTTEYIKSCRTVLQDTLPQSVYKRIMSNQLYK